MLIYTYVIFSNYFQQPVILMFAVATVFFGISFEFGSSFAIMLTTAIKIFHTCFAKYSRILLDVNKSGLTCLLVVKCTYGDYPSWNVKVPK